jgi:hypothetical protein
VSIDRDKEQASWVVTAGAAPPEDWLATVIRKTLRSLVGSAGPSPAVWGQIRQNMATCSSAGPCST